MDESVLLRLVWILLQIENTIVLQIVCRSNVFGKRLVQACLDSLTGCRHNL